MKLFKTIWITLLFAGVLSSCVKDIIPGVTGSDEEQGNGQGKFFSATVSIPMPAATKATRSDGEYRGTNEESLIRGVRIVMYGASSEVVVYSKDIEAFNVWYDGTDEDGNDYYYPDFFYGKDVASSGWSNDDHIYFITVATDEIERGNYKMLVLVNPTDQLKDITEVGQPLSDLYKSATGKNGRPVTPDDLTGDDFTPIPGYDAFSDISNETSSSYKFKYDNFLMLNSQGLVDIKEGNFYKTEELAQAHPVYTGVERAVAKVKVGQVQIVNFANAGTRSGSDYYFYTYQAPYYNGSMWYYSSIYSDRLRFSWDKVTWGADITNKTSYWMRRMANKAGNVMEKRGDQDRYNFYAEDLNFSGISGADLSVRKQEFNYITANDVNKQLIGNVYYPYYELERNPDYFSYVLENTMAASEQMGDVSTRIVVRGVFEFSSKEWDPQPIGSSFYVYKGRSNNNQFNNGGYGGVGDFYILRPEDLQLWATDSRYLPNGNQTLDYYNNPIPAGVTAPADFPDLQAAIDAVKAEFGSSFDFTDPDMESFIVGDLEYYKDGISWYEAPIRHFNDSQEGNVMGYGRYGVVRNNVYNIELGLLYNTGSPVFPEPKPEPNEKEKNMDFYFYIDPWYEYPLEYEFGFDPVEGN